MKVVNLNPILHRKVSVRCISVIHFSNLRLGTVKGPVFSRIVGRVGWNFSRLVTALVNMILILFLSFR